MVPGSGVCASSLVDDAPIRDALSAEAAASLTAGRWDELDALCNRVWSQRERLPSGAWKIAVLMRRLAEPDDPKSDPAWRARIELLTRWQAARPASSAAANALGGCWNGYAGFARGYGYADTVTEEGSRLHGERLATARAILEAGTAMPGSTAEIRAELLEIGIGQGWDRAEMDRCVAEGLAIEPDYHLLHNAMTRYLLPRWHGEDEKEWERYAREVADRADRPDWYARMLVSKIRIGEMADEFRAHASWRRLRKGFEEWDRRYPDSRFAWTGRAFFATIFRQAEEAEAAFVRLEGKPDLELWDNLPGYAKNESWAKQRAAWDRKYGWRNLILKSALPAIAGIGVLLWLIKLRRRRRASGQV